MAFCIAALFTIAGFASGQGIGILIGAVTAVITALMAIVAKEVSLMIVDIADATIETARRGREVQGNNVARSFNSPKSSEPAHSAQMHQHEQATAAPSKKFKRPDNPTLDNYLYRLYLVEKYEIKRNDMLQKFWVLGADDMYNTLNEALNIANEKDSAERIQIERAIEQRKTAIKNSSLIRNLQTSSQ